ncbi:MAG: metallophosphatase family protein [Chloroflexi bacterium]|nr:metallophosphatase family protein [Chloroflexota bacterium]
METHTVTVNFAIPDGRLFRLGVISDTHRYSRPATIPESALGRLGACDAYIHCGDFLDPALLDPLRERAPCYAVLGNVDPPELSSDFPTRLLLHIGTWRVGVIHAGGTNERSWRRTVGTFSEPVDLLCCGHSHRPVARQLSGFTVLNPGSAVDPRGLPSRSAALVELGVAMTIHLMALDPGNSNPQS